MAGPWEKYASPAPADGPWSKYQPVVPAAVEMPEVDAMGNPTGGTMAVQPPAPGDGKPGMLEAVARGALQGATFGGADEAAAAINGAAAAATGGEFDFDRRMKEAQAANKAASDANPWSYGAGQVAGGIAGLLPIMRIPGAMKALGFIGSNLATRSAAAGGSGALMGAAQGYLGTDGDFSGAERSKGLLNGAAFGGALGTAAPAAGMAMGALGRTLAGALAPGNSIPGVGRDAARLLAEDVKSAGGAGAVKTRLQELGDRAMLLDASPSFEGRAQGLAVRPETREAIVAPLLARDAGKNARLQGDLIETLGPARTPSAVEAGFAASREALEPHYGREIAQTQRFDPMRLVDLVDDMQSSAKGMTQRYLSQVQDLLAPVRQTPGQAPRRVVDDSPEGLMATRKALDGMIAKVLEDPQASREGVTRSLNTIRQAVDDQIRSLNPNIKKLDRAYEALAGQSEALKTGGRILDSGKTAVRPVELEAMIEGMMPAERRALATGVRADIDRQVGTRTSDLVALKNVVKGDGDWNRAKLELVFGPDEAAKIFNAVDREAAFEAAYRRIDQNSMTAQRRVAEEGVRPRGDGPTTGDVGTIVAGAAGGPQAAAGAVAMRGVRAANNQALKAADLARNQELARLLVSTDQNGNARLVEALARQLQRGDAANRIGVGADRLAQILLMTQGDNARRALPERFQLR